jgi:hypothetical protein
LVAAGAQRITGALLRRFDDDDHDHDDGAKQISPLPPSPPAGSTTTMGKDEPPEVDGGELYEVDGGELHEAGLPARFLGSLGWLHESCDRFEEAEHAAAVAAMRATATAAAAAVGAADEMSRRLTDMRSSEVGFGGGGGGGSEGATPYTKHSDADLNVSGGDRGKKTKFGGKRQGLASRAESEDDMGIADDSHPALSVDDVASLKVFSLK